MNLEEFFDCHCGMSRGHFPHTISGEECRCEFPEDHHAYQMSPHAKNLVSTLAWGLEARHTELQSLARTGYTPGEQQPLLDRLIADTRCAYSLGLLSYLPTWAKEDA